MVSIGRRRKKTRDLPERHGGVWSMKGKRAQNLIAIALVSALAFIATFARAAEPISEQDAYDIGVDAYIYLFPLVLMDTTRRQAVNVELGQAIGRGPMNVFTHEPLAKLNVIYGKVVEIYMVGLLVFKSEVQQ